MYELLQRKQPAEQSSPVIKKPAPVIPSPLQMKKSPYAPQLNQTGPYKPSASLRASLNQRPGPLLPEPIQRMAEESKAQKPRFSMSNNTGIPTQMKREFEEKSGLSFDDVRVHYNSEKPAQLQALAYTQGNQVYVGQGQEKHLRHELGHVIQQKQGLVRPNTSVSGVPVNDEPKLEQAADQGIVQCRLKSEVDRPIVQMVRMTNAQFTQLFIQYREAFDAITHKMNENIKNKNKTFVKQELLKIFRTTKNIPPTECTLDEFAQQFLDQDFNDPAHAAIAPPQIIMEKPIPHQDYLEVDSEKWATVSKSIKDLLLKDCLKLVQAPNDVINIQMNIIKVKERLSPEQQNALSKAIHDKRPPLPTKYKGFQVYHGSRDIGGNKATAFVINIDDYDLLLAFGEHLTDNSYNITEMVGNPAGEWKKRLL